MRNKKIFISAVILFVVLNVLNTYFITTTLFNAYLKTFDRTFLGEFNAILGNLAIVGLFLLLCLGPIKKQKNQLFALMMVTLLLNIMVYLLGVYIKFYNVAFSFVGLDVFLNPAEGFGMSLIGQTVSDFFVELRFLSFVPFLILLTLYIAYKNKDTYVRKTPKIKVLIKTTTAFIVLMFMLVANLSIYQFTIRDRWQSNVARSTFISQNVGVYPFFVYQLTGYNFLINFQEAFDAAETQELVDLFNTNQSEYTNLINGQTFSNRLTLANLGDDIFVDQSLLNGSDSLHGILADRNLVLVHLESFSQYLYDLFPEMWPFLTNLFDESLVFSNFHANVGIGTSADAEWTILTGLLPTGNSTIYWDYNNRPFFVESLPNLFNQAGFYTQAIQADNKMFYNREVIYRDLMHFDSFFDIDSFHDAFPNVNEVYGHENPWVSDFGMTRMVRTRLLESTYPKFLFTKTMMPHIPFQHNPFVERANEYFFKYDWFDNLTAASQRYLEFVPYMDEVIRSFFFNILIGINETCTNSAFLFYGDHTAQIPNSDIRIMFDDPTMSDTDVFAATLRTKAWLYVPGTEVCPDTGINRGLITGEQSLIRSQLDYFRTVVELFDLPIETPYFGVHLFSNEPTFSIACRFFGVSTQTYLPGRNGFGQAVFQMGNSRIASGEMNLITAEFRQIIVKKKAMMNNWIASSMMNDLSVFG